MSYDVFFIVQVDGKDYECFDTNHTSNTSAMMASVMGSYIGDFNNIPANLAEPYLKEGVYELENNPEKYRKYEPENGWGTVESTLKVLKEMHVQCQITPQAIIKVWR